MKRDNSMDYNWDTENKEDYPQNCQASTTFTFHFSFFLQPLLLLCALAAATSGAFIAFLYFLFPAP
jgi:hypothetical protein